MALQKAEDRPSSLSPFIEKTVYENLLRQTGHSDIIWPGYWESSPFTGTKSSTWCPPPRLITVKFATFEVKDEVLKRAWQKKSFMLAVIGVKDHDYAPDVLRWWCECAEAVPQRKGDKFQTLFPAKLRVFYENATCLQLCSWGNQNMVSWGFKVTIIQPSTLWADKIKSAMWIKSVKMDKEHSKDETWDGHKKRLNAFRREKVKP